VTPEQLFALRSGTTVRLADGSVGRIVIWHKSEGTVEVQVLGRPGLRTLWCGDLTMDALGRVTETTATTPDPQADD